MCLSVSYAVNFLYINTPAINYSDFTSSLRKKAISLFKIDVSMTVSIQYLQYFFSTKKIRMGIEDEWK